MKGRGSIGDEMKLRGVFTVGDDNGKGLRKEALN